MERPPIRKLICPVCRGPLVPSGADGWRCSNDGTVYRLEDGIWRFLRAEGADQAFLERYTTVRRAEGWGSEDPAYYRALPFRDLSGRHPEIWRLRAVSWRALVRHAVEPLARELGRALRVVDLGAGNGWLSYRLAEAGHEPIAVDLFDDDHDGLGALRHYPVEVPGVQASFDRLPWDGGAFDLAVFNGSLHYSRDIRATLAEALRVVVKARVAVLDSPIYRRRESGETMLEERRRDFQERFGFDDDTPQEGFLTPVRLEELARELGLVWRTIRPWYGLRWALLPWKARLLGRREPARFYLLAGRARLR